MRLKTKLGTCLATVSVVAVAAWTVAGGSGPAGASTGAAATASGGTWGLSLPLPGFAAPTATAGSRAGGPVRAVTCTTRGNCVAVGFSVTGSGSSAVYAPAVATETAGTWGSVQPVRGAASLGSTTQLAQVSCGAAGDCTATGTYNGTDGRVHAWYVSETAGAWGTATAVSEAGQPAGTYSTITAVSCPAVGYCAVVGNYVTSGTTTSVVMDTPFILDEAGGTWGTPQPVPGLSSLPSAGSVAVLESVSCAAPGECTAGGGYGETTGAAAPFVVSETSGTSGTGGTWGGAQQVTGTPDADITSVSCPDATDCTAAGIYQGSSSSIQAFTADEQQGTWGTADLLANASITSMGTPKLACASAGNCVLADTAYGIKTPPEPLHTGAVADSETSSGDWGTVTPIAVPASTFTGEVTLSWAGGASCSPGGDCTIAGYYDTSELLPFTMFAVTSTDGVVGKVQPVSPATGASPVITGLACPQSGYCTLAYNLNGAPEVVTEATAATVTLTASAPAITYGSEPAETLTATVSSPAGGTPTGTVTVTGPGGGTFCTITLSGGSGNCRNATPGLAGGTDMLTATYSGDANYVAARGTTTVTVKPAATTTSLGISPASATFSGKDITVTFAANVTSAAGTPAGTVDVTINGTGLDNCDGNVLTAGKVTCTSLTWVRAPGRYAITVGYPGDADFAPSTSAVRYLTVSKAKTITTLRLSEATVTYGHERAEKFTVSVSHAGSVYPTGKVAVRIGGTTICTISLNKGTGSCTLGSTRLRAGTYQMAAHYAGNGDYNSSTSASKTLKVTE